MVIKERMMLDYKLDIVLNCIIDKCPNKDAVSFQTTYLDVYNYYSFGISPETLVTGSDNFSDEKIIEDFIDTLFDCSYTHKHITYVDGEFGVVNEQEVYEFIVSKSDITKWRLELCDC